MEDDGYHGWNCGGGGCDWVQTDDHVKLVHEHVKLVHEDEKAGLVQACP